MDTNSPLNILTVALVRIRGNSFPGLEEYRHSNGQSYLLGVAVSVALGRVPTNMKFSYAEMSEDYVRLLGICASALEFVSRNSRARARESNMSVIQKIQKVLWDNTIYSYTDSFGSPIPNDVMTALVNINNNLEEEDVWVEQENIDQIIRLIDSLNDEVKASDIPPQLKNRMLRTLASLRDALNRINLIGPDQVLEDMDRMLGQLTQNALIDNDAHSRELLHRGAQMVQDLSLVVTAFKDHPELPFTLPTSAEKILP